MVLWSRYVSPVRFLLCAVFMGIAFALASWTSASADDTGLLSTVDEALPSVGKVVDDTTSAVVRTSSAVPVVPAVPVVELEPVVKPAVTQVVEVVDEPVKVVDRTTADVAEMTTKTLSDSTVRVTDTVKEVAPVSAAVVDPVVDVVEAVVPSAPVEDSAPSSQVPDAGDEVVDALDPEGAGSVSSDAPVAVVGPGAAASTAPAAPTTLVATDVAVIDEMRSPAALSSAAPSAATAPVAVARATGGSPAERLPAGQPTGPLAVNGGPAPSPGGASSSGAPDAGLAPSSLELPEFASSGVTSELSCHAPGPCADPGSRPG